MDDLLSEFLTECAENLAVVDAELVKLEREPNNKDVLGRIFRLVHTIKGTCGFIGLPKLETLAHASENMLGKFRDGALQVTPAAVTLILASLDRIKEILSALERDGAEPANDNRALIERLESAAEGRPIGAAPASTVEVVQANAEAHEMDDVAGRGNGTVARALDIEATVKATPQDVLAAALPQAPFHEAAVSNQATPAEDGKGGASIANQSIRVNVQVLEDLMTMVSELVLTRNQLLEMVRKLNDSEFKVPLQRLSNVTAELQESVMKTRMQPIGNAWQKLPRIVRDLASELGKKIDLVMHGAETELDRQVLELIKDPLTHMVRNSADHGLEMPKDRKAAGKSETGHITLSAYHEGGHIIIEIADDGKGLDIDRIKAKVQSTGLASEADLAGMSDAQIQRYIFHAGFSTASKVTSVSGRGVGMDVVRTNIELIGGSIDLKSERGQGTRFIIKIPLTLAIISALIVGTAGMRFAVPQISVLELVRSVPGSDTQIETIHKTPVLRLRNRLLPLLYLSEVLALDLAAKEPAETFIVVASAGGRTFGIVVDAVFDTEEIVVKPVSALLSGIPMYSGTTILGDGSVILIVDPNGLAQTVHGSLHGKSGPDEESAAVQPQSAPKTQSLLLFRAHGSEPKAVPLSLVTRLEEFAGSQIERSMGRGIIQYRGKLMPLIEIGTPRDLASDQTQPVLVFQEEDVSVGLAVDEIVDIVDEALDIELASARPGLLGTARVRGRATEVVDIAHYLAGTFTDLVQARAPNSAGRKRVLLVDDSAFFRTMMAPLLTLAGYDVTEANSGADALRLKDEGRLFDVILSDIDMPGLDGYALAAAVKADPSWKCTPVIGLGLERDVRASDRGKIFDRYAPKFDRDYVLSNVRLAMESEGRAA